MVRRYGNEEVAPLTAGHANGLYSAVAMQLGAAIDGTLLGHFVTDSIGFSRSTSEGTIDGNGHFRYGSASYRISL